MKRIGIKLPARICYILAGVLLLSTGCGANPSPAAHTETEAPVESLAYDGPAGYRGAVATEEGFLAVGTGGRLDQITLEGQASSLETGTQENLNDVWSDSQTIFACGENGTLLRSEDEETFTPCELGSQADLYDLAYFHGAYYGAAEGGVLYHSGDGVNWVAEQLGTENDVIALAATDACLVAITAETNVFISEDGSQWREINFNEKYDGLYPPYVFVNAVGAGETFFILGYYKENPNVPLIMYTETGEVWMQKSLTEINGEAPSEEDYLRINEVGFNVDQILGVCDGGKLLSITECSVCHEMRELEGAGDLWAVAVRPESVLVCGENFYFQVIDGQSVRQDKIGAEQARADMEAGALLIDVREQEELDADGYIPGSIHIPVDQVESLLPQFAPDQNTELIFYCAVGVRAQTALETALSMGYQNVYNLGGLSDWPYEIVMSN